MTNINLLSNKLVGLVDLAGDYSVVKTAFNDAIGEMGPLYLFINCAGMAICGTLEDVSTNDIMVLLIINIQCKIYK